MPAAERGVEAGSGGYLEDFAGQERRDGHVPRSAGVEVKQVREPACAHREDEGAGGDACEDRGGELRTVEADGSHNRACNCCGERVGEEEAGGWPEELGDSAEAVRAEDRQAHCAFGEIEDHRGEAERWAEGQADEDDGERLEGERNGREVERERDVRADGDETCCGDSENSFAGEGAGQVSNIVGGADLKRERGLHEEVLSVRIGYARESQMHD